MLCADFKFRTAMINEIGRHAWDGQLDTADINSERVTIKFHLSWQVIGILRVTKIIGMTRDIRVTSVTMVML